MKKFLLILCLIPFTLFAKESKKPIVDIQGETESYIEVINDSTIEYFQVYSIQVAQHSDVYTAIIKSPEHRGEKPLLMIMAPGSFIWNSPDRKPHNYILYSGKAFDKVVLRIK